MDRTGCSASTIRRDLSKLQLAGKLQRIHGGATLNHNRMVEPRLTEKLTQNSREKKEIAKQAARQIRDNECVFRCWVNNVRDDTLHRCKRYYCCN